MFLNISTGGDLKRIVVRLCAWLFMTGAQASRLQPPAHLGFRLCTCLLIVGLVGQTLIVGPLPRAKAETRVLTSVQTMPPAPVSAPPAPFSVQDNSLFGDASARSSALAFLPEATEQLAFGVASLVGFASPNPTESKERESGFENAVLEPLRKTVDSVKLKIENEDSADSTDSPDSFDPNSEFLNPQSPAPPPAGDVEFDFDGDNKADIGRWRGVATHFQVKNSGGGADSEYTLGSSSAVAAPGDFNGDGKTDAAVFSAGTWTYKTSISGSAQTISFGATGDIPYAGDYS